MDQSARIEDESAWLQAVEERFRALRGRPLLLSPADFERARAWYRQGIPLWLVLGSLEEVFRQAAHRRPPVRPRSLAYCEPAVLEAFAAWKERRIAAQHAVGHEEGRGGGVEVIDRAVQAIEASRAPASARELARQRLAELRGQIERGEGVDLPTSLGEIGEDLAEACLATLPADEIAALQRTVEEELSPWTSQMSPEVLEQAGHAALLRRIRERFDLPDLGLLPYF